MYTNMGGLEQFKKLVIVDGRSYSDETFAKSLKIITDIKKGVKVDQEDVNKFQQLVQELKELKEEAKKTEVSIWLV